MAPAPRPAVPALLDRFGRLHSYIRVSVTDRCNYRCTYCLPEAGLTWLPRQDVLTYEEIARLVRVFAAMGVRRVRLTGGEPTVRRDLLELVAAISAVPGIEDLSMTTNAHLLAPLARQLRDAGLRRVNISLDSLDPERFARITRGGRLGPVIEAITEARAVGLCPIKINMVVMKGQNDDEILAMARYFLPYAETTVLRFIEYMPFDGRWHENVSAAQQREVLASELPLSPMLDPDGPGDGPARYWRAGPLKVGFIAPLTEHFCASCNRLRLLADGNLRTCLAHEPHPNLRDVIRAGASDEELSALIRQIVRAKPAGHEVQVEGGRFFEGVMTGIGG